MTKCTAVLASAVALAAGSRAAEKSIEARAKEIAPMLAERPGGFGRPITDRPAWQRLAGEPSYRDVVRRAEGLLEEPIPDSPDDLYLDFSRTGNRTRWQRVSSQRRGRIPRLVLAECLENKGRFVPAIEAIVAAVCAERTWVMPAHDRGLGNFKGTQIDIDLGSAHLGVALAQAHYLLGETLSAAAREMIRSNVRRRILGPYLEMVAGTRRKNWWITGTNNWNTVCLACVTGAGLAMAEPRQERATFVAAGEAYSRNFLKGFTADGYCSEGLGYWNYGFGHYVLLAEAIGQATGGQVDLTARPEARAPATYPWRMEIIGEVYPAFADCSVSTRPSWSLVHFIRRRLGLGADPAEDGRLVSPGSLFGSMMYSFPNSATQAPPAEKAAPGPGLRDWFDQAGVLICRPGEAPACRMGVALKGGHNGEHHNHNDVGSYVAVVGRQPVLLDPGAEVYTSRTFSSRRYDSNVLNSYGHPVPRVAGRLQKTGRGARGQVVRTEFTEDADTLVLDLRAAYDAPELQQLRRTFVYSRKATGRLTVTDEVVFSSPKEFETAVITLGRWKQLDGGGLMVYYLDEAVRVDVEADGGDVEITSEQIKEDVRTRSLPTRIGIRLKQPVTKAAITLKITPAVPAAKGAGTGLLRNGGFEHESWCWDIPRRGMGSLSRGQAAGGDVSLKIVDADRERGSNIRSAGVPAGGGEDYQLRGKVLPVSGDGLGMYVRFLDKDQRLLNAVGARGYIDSIGTLGGSSGRWQAFALPFRTPPGTASLEIWIHSYTAAQVEAYLDDLEIIP